MGKSRLVNEVSKKEKDFVEQFLSYDEHLHWIGKNQKVNYKETYLLQTYSIAGFALIILAVLIFSLFFDNLSQDPYQRLFQIAILLFLLLLLSFAAYMFFYYTKLIKKELFVITNKRCFVVTNHYKLINFIPLSSDLLVKLISNDKKYKSIVIGKNMKMMVETVNISGVLGSLFSSRQLVQDKKVKVKDYKFYKITFRNIADAKQIKNLILNQCKVSKSDNF